MQLLGRGSRVRPGSGKKMPYVVDFMNDPDCASSQTWPRLCIYIYIYNYMEDIRNIHKVYYSQTFHKLQFRYTANSCCTHHIHKLDCCESLINYKLLVITQQVLVCFSTSHFPPVEFPRKHKYPGNPKPARKKNVMHVSMVPGLWIWQSAHVYCINASECLCVLNCNLHACHV